VKYLSIVSDQNKDKFPLVFIIVLDFEKITETLETIDSVRSLRYPNAELLVVENSASSKIVHELSNCCPNLRILSTGSNLGYAGGNNAGIEYGLEENADYILVLNNDVIVDPDLLDRLVETMEGDSACAGCQPLVMYEHDRVRVWSAGTEMWFGYPRLFRKNSYDLPAGVFAPPFGLVGCALMMRTSVLREIGLFYEPLFLMHEETEWCMRARKKGYSLLTDARTKVYHKVSATLGAFSPSYLYYISRNWIIVSRMHFSLPKYLMVVTTEILIRLPFYTWRLSRMGSIGMIRYYLAGIRDGLAGNSGKIELH
jgi:GT2 family glycosyltransferase